MPWLRRLRDADGVPEGRLVFFPPAGGNASAAAALAPAVPDTWSLWGVQYPARGPRLQEPQASSLRGMAHGCSSVLAEDALPAVLFGHSFGALVAYDVAQLLERRDRDPAGLLVAGSSAPGPASDQRAGGQAGELTDATLIAFLRDRGGTAPDLLVDEELMQLVLPALRTDLTLARGYRDDHGRRLRAPVLALGGRGDLTVSKGQLEGWRHLTDSWLGLVRSKGGHFFHVQDTALISAVLREHWSPDPVRPAIARQ
jgi:surfactin synthase thioesterase subunit